MYILIVLVGSLGLLYTMQSPASSRLAITIGVFSQFYMLMVNSINLHVTVILATLTEGELV